MAQARMRIRTTVSGQTGETFIKTIERRFSKGILYRDLWKVRNDILAETDAYIKTQRKRPESVHTGDIWRLTAQRNLINVLKAGSFIEQTGISRFRLGIGNIDLLDTHAPYWYKINYGGKIDMKGAGYLIKGGKYKGKTGLFGSFSGPSGTFFKGKGPGFLMVPINPIPPMRYLSKMASIFTLKMAQLNVDYRRRLKARRR